MAMKYEMGLERQIEMCSFTTHSQNRSNTILVTLTCTADTRIFNNISLDIRKLNQICPNLWSRFIMENLFGPRKKLSPSWNKEPICKIV